MVPQPPPGRERMSGDSAMEIGELPVHFIFFHYKSHECQKFREKRLRKRLNCVTEKRDLSLELDHLLTNTSNLIWFNF